jgi:hypothetical protein
MKDLKVIFLVFLYLSFILSCKTIEEINTCDESNSPFQSLFLMAATSGLEERISIDTEVHEYSFELTADKTLCKIGYQSQQDDPSVPYIIELYDNDANTLMYSEPHTFSRDQTSYIIPGGRIRLFAGTSYTVRRIQTNWGNDIGNTIGRVVVDWENMLSFPFQYDEMTITGSGFYQNGGPLSGYAIPYIDLIFE